MLPAITVGLQDLDDDVRAVAAAALIPVVEGLVQLLPNKVRDAVVEPFEQCIRIMFHFVLRFVTCRQLFFNFNLVVKFCVRLRYPSS